MASHSLSKTDARCTFTRQTIKVRAKNPALPACCKRIMALDWVIGIWSGKRRAQPGDTILMHAGLYKNDRLNYVDPQMTPFDGTTSLTLKGTRDKPITIKSAGDGEVIFDGAGNHRLFDVMASHYHIFDGLTIRNTDVAIFAGQKEVLGAVGLTVKNCRFENIGFGVWTEYAGSSDFYIADNLFLRPRDDYASG